MQPATFTDALPVADPAQFAGSVAVCAFIAAGSEMLMLSVETHPFASCTVTEYAPADKFVALAPFPPEGDQL